MSESLRFRGIFPIYIAGHQAELEIRLAKAHEAADHLSLTFNEVGMLPQTTFDVIHGALLLGLEVEKVTDPAILDQFRCKGIEDLPSGIAVDQSAHELPFGIGLKGEQIFPTLLCPVHPLLSLIKQGEKGKL